MMLSFYNTKVPGWLNELGSSGWTTYVIHQGIFFIENFIMAEIFQLSDKIKLIFILYTKKKDKHPHVFLK